MKKDDQDQLLSLLKNEKDIENNLIFKQILTSFATNDTIKRLLNEFYIKVPTNIYISYHSDLIENRNLHNTMPFYDINSFIVVLSLYDTSLLNQDRTSEFLNLNQKLLADLRENKEPETQNNKPEIKGGGSNKKNKYIVINDGSTKRYVLIKNNKYQILNETDSEYLLSTKNRGIIRMKK